MRTTIVQTLRFEAAHRLPKTPAGHRCSRLHGHSFQLELHVTGPVDPETGWICDFADIETASQSLLEILDHHYLNEIPGLENPTSEHLARFVFEHLHPKLPGLSQVVVHETCDSRCVYSV